MIRPKVKPGLRLSRTCVEGGSVTAALAAGTFELAHVRTSCQFERPTLKCGQFVRGVPLGGGSGGSRKVTASEVGAM